MGLTISRTDILLEYRRTPSKLEIESKNARLDLHQKHAKINIHTELPRVKIDQYECFASAGLKNNGDLIRDAARRAYQQVMEFIGKTASDGYALAAIEKGGNPIAAIAKRDADPIHEFGLDYIPKARPKIEIEGDLKFDPERNSEGINNGVEGTYHAGEVNYNYNPSSINISVKRYPSVKFDFTGVNLDAKV